MSPEHPILDLLTPSRTYTVSDLLHWADVNGQLHPHWTKFLAAVACQQQANAKGLAADGDKLQAMSEEFRYLHDITTAEETEHWLEHRLVDLDSFTAWLERCYWREAIEDPAEPEAQTFAGADADLQALFVEDVIFSDALDQLAQKFGRRLVAHYHPRSEAPPSAEEIEAARQLFLQSHPLGPSASAEWLEALGRDPLWLEEMITLEAAYQAEHKHYSTPTRKAEALRGLRLPLTRFQLEWIECTDLDTAREAALCLREDGRSIPAFANETGFPCQEIARFADELPVDLQQRLLSAAPGETLEPEPLDEGFRVLRVAAKQEPSLDDPAVNSRLEQCLLDAAFAERCHQYLRSSLAPLGTCET